MANKEPNFFQHLRDFAGRMSCGPRGAGVGLKLLIGAGALAYGIKKLNWITYYTPRRVMMTEHTNLQMVNIALRVLSQPVASNLPYMNQHLGKDYDERALPSIVSDVLKISLLIRRLLVEHAKDFSIIVDDVALTELSFSREYTSAVEAKQVGQDQRQKIIQAEGEAQAAKMLGEAVTRNPGYLKLRRIRAAQSVAKTVVTSQNRIYLNADSLVLNLQYESFNNLSAALLAVGKLWEQLQEE
ncbi:hypothetical protein Q7C36_006051 [Tachysurus vachellii]|uniref:Prohibitin n=1 Tax=Tachysurus vachellii TaxID=175792 RepID=A0AA88T2D1_TACVA|nr:hypothetical protein Q7C36_006051 [Tachysurus vachellii]